MGKHEDQQRTAALTTATEIGQDDDGVAPSTKRRSVGRVVMTLLAAAAVILPVLFLLPPFFRHGNSGDGSRDRDPWFKANIVASFWLQKPVGLLQSNIVKLRYDIYEEIGVADSSVSVLSLNPMGASNWTNVIFGIWPYPGKYLVPSTALSLLRSSFMSLVIRQSTLHLTTALFGNSSVFEVLKFPGGITIVPIQTAFLLQKPQTLFNFTLNFPISQVQNKLIELKGQLKSGLLLNDNENLYFQLTNLEGSTVAPPTIIQTSIVLAVGNHPPSLPRLKQLAKNIRNSSAGNLGLNHTVFGRVKQIRLSSYFQHSLNTSNSTTPPSPSPQPHSNHHHHHHNHHHHHHHHHHYDVHFPPVPTPAPAPAPKKDSRSRSNYRCWHEFSRKPKRKAYLTPSSAPASSSNHMVAPETAPKPSGPIASGSHSSPTPPSARRRSAIPSSAPQGLTSPPVHDKLPAPVPNSLPAPPFPIVFFSHAHPPGKSVTEGKPPDTMPTISPTPYSSSTSEKHFFHWVLVLVFYVILGLKQ